MVNLRFYDFFFIIFKNETIFCRMMNTDLIKFLILYHTDYLTHSQIQKVLSEEALDPVCQHVFNRGSMMNQQ